jgi:hypothetical protein
MAIQYLDARSLITDHYLKELAMVAGQDIEKIIKKTQRYEFLDGLRDMQLGIYMALLGFTTWLVFQPATVRLILWLRERVDKFGSIVGIFLIVLLPAIVALGVQQLMYAIRKRWLWQESGMVKPLLMVVPRWITFVSVLVLLTGLGLGLLLQPLFPRPFFVWGALWGSTGLSFGFLLAAMGRHLQIRRYVWVGILGGVGSTVLVFLPLSLVHSVLVWGLGWGVMLVCSGLLALRRTWPQVGEGAADV